MKSVEAFAHTRRGQDGQCTEMTPGLFARAALWSALAFVANLGWEIAHARLYTIWATKDRIDIAWSVLHCTVGDVLMALALFVVAGVALRRADWPTSRPWMGGAIVVTSAVAFTAWSEWYNVYRVGSWSYTASMPLIFGIGLSPLLQWLILPPLMMGGHRMLLPEERVVVKSSRSCAK